MSKSELEDALAKQLDDAGLKYERQYKFHPTRRWKADFAFPEEMVLVEVQGSTWARMGAKKCPVCKQIPKGRHGMGAGFEKDRIKMNEAQLKGWLVLEVTAGMVKDGSALEFINRALVVRRTNEA
jgi:G:T-mismatch repair DNA endonuclease (very short patch repair protein)